MFFFHECQDYNSMIFVFLGLPVSQKDILILPISHWGLHVDIDGFHGEMGNSIYLTTFSKGCEK